MTTRLAINGFGRIGRLILRALIEQDRRDLEIVAINDLGPVESSAHLLRFDSVHGRFPGTITTNGPSMDAGHGPIRVTAERDPARLDWSDIDLVLECTGIFKDAEAARVHLDRGAARVLVSAPASGADRTIVYGVNHDSLRPEDRIISNASCTTNCLAPVAQVLHQAVGITRGFMTTVHSYTGDQPTLDRQHSDLYRARAAALSMIPTSTGAAKAVGLVLPELAGKLDGVALRVPTPNVSAIDLTFDAARATSVAEINAAITEAAAGRLKGILTTTDQPNVSADFNHDPHSSVFHLDQTRVMEGQLVRVLAWYDNEWAYAARMLDTAGAIGRLG
ncbi:type I glyceraldehyde-3-phosphate dehydrogenase [Pararhodobacter sp.]|jgi:glyceraldehyde 3-phosphate dehydrogenase|uniref:type I glyceraldehyde-3-phosphate dehydrogenase n=1 Tax=Pararhodobacter sp. TaxID=2127056 RepID=UPI002FDE1454